MNYTPKVTYVVTLPNGFESVVFFEAPDPKDSFQQCFTHTTDAELDAKVRARAALADKPDVGRVIDLAAPVETFGSPAPTKEEVARAAWFTRYYGRQQEKKRDALDADLLADFLPEYLGDL